jgi:hypothetical protein
MDRLGGSEMASRVRELMDETERPVDEVRSRILFEQVMTRMAEQKAQRERVWWLARTIGTTFAALAGAGASAMRLLPYLK